MHIESLYYLVELSKTHSMTQVANKQNISTSAMSQAISQLEASLGLKLFERTSSGTYPTVEGEYIISLARKVIESYNLMLDQAQKLQMKSEKTLRIGVSNEAPNFLIQLLLDFQQEHENFNVELYEYQSKEIVNLVNMNEIDLGFIYATLGALMRLTDLNFEKLYDDEIKLFMSSDHYLANQDPVNMELLLQQEFVVFQDEYISDFITTIQEEYGQIKILTRTSSVAVLVDMIHNFKAVSFIRNKQLKGSMTEISDLNLVAKEVPQLPSKPMLFGLVYKKYPSFEILVLKFINEVRAYFRVK